LKGRADGSGGCDPKGKQKQGNLEKKQSAVGKAQGYVKSLRVIKGGKKVNRKKKSKRSWLEGSRLG